MELCTSTENRTCCELRGHSILSHNETGQLTATFVRETWQRSRDRKKKCATNFFSLFSCGKYNATDGDGYIEFENRNNYRPESVNGLCKHESWRRGKWLSTFLYIFQAPSRTCPLPPPKKIIRTLHLYHNPPPKKKMGSKRPPFHFLGLRNCPLPPPSPPKKIISTPHPYIHTLQ